MEVPGPGEDTEESLWLGAGAVDATAPAGSGVGVADATAPVLGVVLRGPTQAPMPASETGATGLKGLVTTPLEGGGADGIETDEPARSADVGIAVVGTVAVGTAVVGVAVVTVVGASLYPKETEVGVVDPAFAE